MPFESNRMKIRKGELAQTQRLRPGDGEGPLEPDEIFDFDPVKDQQAPLESPVWDLNDPSQG
jgi:hypothetical protein